MPSSKFNQDKHNTSFTVYISCLIPINVLNFKKIKIYLMKKKILYIILFLVIFWTFIFGGLIFLQKTTRVWENTLQDKILATLPPNSEFSLGKIRGNLFGSFSIDSSHLQIDTSMNISFSKIRIEYSIFSLITGDPKINHIQISKPVLRLKEKYSDQFDSTSTTPPIYFQDQRIQFEKILPDTIHLTLQRVITSLPDVTLNSISIIGGEIISGEKTIVSALNLNLNYSKKSIKCDHISGKFIGKIKVDDGYFHAQIEPDAILISQLNVISNKSNISGKIDIDFYDQFKALVVIDECNLSDVLEQINASDTTEKKLDMGGYFYLYPESLFFEINVTGIYDTLILDKSYIKGTIGKNLAYLHQIFLKSNIGEISGKVFSVFGGKTVVSLEASGVDVSPFVKTVDSSEINLFLRADFDSWNIKSLNADFRAQLTSSFINEMKIYKSILMFRSKNGNFVIDSTSGLYLTDNDFFQVKGKIDNKFMGELELNFIDVDFNRVGKSLGVQDLYGWGSGSFVLKGNLEDPDAYSYLLLDSLSYGGITGYGIEEIIEIKQLFSKREGEYLLDISSGNINGLEITDAVADISILGEMVAIDSLNFYNLDNFVTINGVLQFYDSHALIELNNFAISYESISLFNDEKIILDYVYEESKILFESFHLITKQGGEVDGRGELSFSNPSSFALYLKQINLNFINQFQVIDFSTKGFANLEFIFTESFSEPEIEFDGAFTSLSLDTIRLGNIHYSGIIQKNNLDIKSFSWESQTDSLYISGMVNLESIKQDTLKKQENSFFIDIRQYDLYKIEKLFNVNFPIRGNIQGRLEFGNTLENLNMMGTLTLQHFRYREFAIDSLFINSVLRDGQFHINTGVLKIADTDFLFTMSVPFDYKKIKNNTLQASPFNAFVTTSTDNLSFLGDMNEEIQNIRGKVNASMQIGGTLEAPLIEQGNIYIDDGTIYLYKLANPIFINHLRAVINKNNIIIEECTGASETIEDNKSLIGRLTDFLLPFLKKDHNRSNYRISGKITLDKAFKPDLDLTVTAENLFINYFIEDVRAVVSTNHLTIKGKDTITVAGNIKIHSGKYLFDADKYERSLLLSAGEVELPPYLKLNLKVDLPGRFYFKQEGQINKMSFELLGNLRILKEPKDLIEPYGILEILSGDMTLYGKKIHVISGKISFDNPKELPRIEILADYKDPPYYFEIRETGRIDAPELEISLFNIDSREEIVGYDIKDKLSILVTGMAFNDLKKQGDEALKEQGIELATKSLMSMLEGTTEELVGLDKVSLETSNKLNQGLIDASLALGKYLTNNLYFELRSPLQSSPFANKLSWEPGNELYLQYRLNRNWTIGTTVSKTEEGNNKINFNFAWKLFF